jgi:hypothetical protein
MMIMIMPRTTSTDSMRERRGAALGVFWYAESFCEKDGWVAMSVCIRHHADNLKAEAAIEQRGMLTPASDGVKRLEERLRQRQVPTELNGV